MEQYHALCEHILEHGTKKEDRTGTGTLSVFGHQMRFSLQDGFPLITTKKLHMKSIIHELIWFISAQWRSFPRPDGTTVDQLAQVIEQIKTNPDSRRLIVSAWNPGQVDEMALPPCHLLFQFYVADGKLSCQLYQRSADVFLGVPFNIASYALLTHMIAHVCGLEVGDFVHTLGDAHIYSNHIEQVNLQLTRTPKKLPTLRFARTVDRIEDFRFEDIIIEGYDPDPHIKGVVAE